ncbi:MAG: glycosyltransferase family 39 protein, partial [Nanoarchaeota archaeon]
YLAYAKNLANLGGDWIVTAQHNSLFPFIVAVLFSINFSEAAVKFILEILPSIFIVVLTYLICLKMYSDKRIALISSFLMTVFWVLLFNSTRFHLEAPGFFLGLLAIYVFFQGYENKEKIFGKINPNWAIPLAVIFVILTYAIRRGYFLFGVFILVYMMLTKNWKELIKDKYNWIGLGLGIVLLFLVEKFLFFSGVSEVGSAYFHPENPIILAFSGIFKSFFSSFFLFDKLFLNVFQSIYFYLFLIGIISIVGSMILYAGHFKRLKNKKIFSDLFVLISIVLTLIMLYFIVIPEKGKNFVEERWYLPLALGAFIAVSQGALLIGDYIKKYSKIIGIIFIILLIAFGGYYQVK